MDMEMTKQQAEKEEAQRIIERKERLASNRTNWERHWQECMDYIVPRKNDIVTTKTGGEKRNTDLFDTTAIMANQLLAGALHGMLTNPATRFFELVMGDPALDDSDDVKEWLQLVGDRLFSVLNNSNFQTEIHEVYIDLGAIGTACLYIAEHDENVMHFSARSMKEIFVDENNLGLIDTVYRVFRWKPKQIMQEFGEENCPKFVCEAHKKGCNDEWEIVHAVEPSEEKGYFPYSSRYILTEQKAILHKGGYKEFPYAVPRWTKTSGEIYGRGPGMDMLPDIKMVNKMMETTLKGAQMTVTPPMMVADDGVIGKLRLTPAGVTVVRAGEPPIRPLITDARVDFGYQAVDDVRRRIRAGYYVDQLQLNEGPQMTATEVMQRTEEKLRLMGPVLGRQHFEFLRPLIERGFGIMMRKGLIPPAPKAIAGKNIDVRYSSLVARAQRMSDGQNITRALSVAGPIAQVKPEVLDNLDGDKAFAYIMDVYGVPQKIMHNKRKVEEARKARAQAQEQAMQQMQEQHQAEVAGKVMPGAAQMMMAQQQGAQKQ